MADKVKPLGICDLCDAAIPANRWYTSKGKPRLYCSIDCRNAGNSRAGEPIRYSKMMVSIERGEWRNPVTIRPPTSEEQSARARAGRLKEVQAGVWRNPALSQEARDKLSRPRKHSGALAAAIDKLDRGLSMAELLPDEAEAYRAYRREARQR